MRTAVKKADAVVHARRGVHFPHGQGPHCDTTITSFDLYRALAEALRFNTTVTSLNLYHNDLGEGGGRALAEELRVNTTLAKLDLGGNDLREGGWQALVEALRVNTTLESLAFDTRRPVSPHLCRIRNLRRTGRLHDTPVHDRSYRLRLNSSFVKWPY